MKRFLILAVAAGLVLSACASASLPSAGGQRDGDTSPKTVRSNAPAATPEKTAPKARKHAASEPKSCQPLTGGTEGSVAQLVDVRIGTQYFGLPRYELVPATPPITEDGSGDPVSMDGSRYAVIVFHGASGVDMTADEYTVTYSGPHDFRPGYIGLAEARQTGDYEATLSWAFGLNSSSCWSVNVLQKPLRVAVDFPHD